MSIETLYINIIEVVTYTDIHLFYVTDKHNYLVEGKFKSYEQAVEKVNDMYVNKKLQFTFFPFDSEKNFVVEENVVVLKRYI